VPYTKGMKIEVSKLVDNSVVAWLPAFVAKTFWKNNLLVDYTVSNNDGTALPDEIVDVKHVRPCPPQASDISFCINDEVEAFQGGGWWLGVITDVHPELKYTFKSAHLGMKVQLSQKLLRPRYDWVYGLQVRTNLPIIYFFQIFVKLEFGALSVTVCFLYVLKLQDRLHAHNADNVLLCFISYNLVMYLTKLFLVSLF